MEKSVKYIIILLLGLAIILGASGFSLIVHHCFTADLTEVRIRSGHSDNCCYDTDHVVAQDNVCCTEESRRGKQDPIAEINHQCCEEGFVSVEGLPVYHKTNSPETDLVFQKVFTNISKPSAAYVRESKLSGNYIPPSKPFGKHILLVNQVFML